MAGHANAETLNWSTRPNVNLLTTTDSATVNGVTIQTSGVAPGSFTQSGNTIQPTFPAIYNQMDSTVDNSSSYIETKFVFSEPVYNLSFQIVDIDGGLTCACGWNDVVTITSDNGAPTGAVTAGVNYSVAGTVGTAAASANTATQDTAIATVTFPQAVTTVTVRHYAADAVGTDPVGQYITLGNLTFLRSPRLTINKGFTPAGVATTFNFDMSNSGAGTTATSVAVPASGAATNGTQIRLNVAATATTVTETGPAGWVMSGATAACTDSNSANSGNPASFTAPIASGGKSFTVAAANIRGGAVITCAVTNSRATVSISKTTLGGVGGPFNFTMTNLSSAATSATTAAGNNPALATSSPFRVTTIGTSVGITETVAAGYTTGGAVCTDSNGGAPVSSTTASVTIPGGSVVNGSAYSCVFTNYRQPNLQLAKAWGANNIAGNVAGIGATTGGTNNTTAFTANAGTAANSGAVVTISVGNSIILPAETFTTGTAANYATVVSCTADGGATANTLSGTDGQVSNTLQIGAGDAGKAIVCTYTNTRKSTTLRLSKAWGANSLAGNTATIPATTDLINNTASFNTAAPAGASTATDVTVFAGETATLRAETMSPGSLTTYNTVLACNVGTLSGTNGQASNTLPITAAMTTTNPIICTYTNNPKAPTLSLQKSFGGAGRIAAADQFSLTATGTGAPGAVITTGAGTAVTSAALSFTAAHNAAYVLDEAMAAGSASNLLQYTQTAACTNGLSVANGGTDVSAITSVPINVTPHNGDVIACTITNIPKVPTLSLQKSLGGAGRIAAADQFSLTATGAGAPAAVTTTGAGTAVTSSAQSFVATAGSAYTLTEAMAAGSTSTLLQYTQGVVCTNSLSVANNGTDVSGFNSLPINVTPKHGDVISCTVTNTPKAPTLSLQKSLGGGGRIAAADQFSLTATGTGAPGAVATTGTLANVTSTALNFTATAGSAYSLNEAMAAGSNSLLTQYAQTVACTNSLSVANGGTDVSGLTSLPVNVTPVNGDVIACTINNSPKRPTLQLVKAWGANFLATDTANIGATAGASTNTTAFSATGGTGASSNVVNLDPGNAITLPVETFTPAGSAANYATDLTCAATPGPLQNPLAGANGQSAGNLLTIGTLDQGKVITCTYTNTRKQTTLRLAKAWGANSLAGNVATLGATTGLTNNTASFTSTASTNTTGVAVTAFAGETATLPAETMSPGALASYTTTVACNAGTLTGTNGQSSGNTLLITGAATTTNPITCTYTNTPRAPTLSLQKALGGTGRIVAADQFSLSATGTGAPGAVTTAGSGATISSAALSFTATHNAAYVLNEAMAAGSASALTQYSQIVACTNTLSVANGGTDVSGINSLPINVTPHNGDQISCTITNTPKAPTLQLTKVWGSNSIAGNVAQIGATTGGAANTTAFSATASTGNSSIVVTIAVGNTLTFPAETMSTGTLANYTTVLACTANGGATTNALSGSNGQAANTLVIAAADAGKAIVCTYTNTRKQTTLRVDKSWAANSIAGNVASMGASTGLINNTAAISSTAAVNTTGTAVTVYAGEIATFPAETMTTGVLANYTTALSCTAGTLSGSDGQVSNTLSITAAATATSPIVCTYTNTRKSTTFRLAKAWAANSIAGNVASLGATSGLINNTTLFTAPASATTNGATVTIYAGETATLPAETMATGTLANYTTAVTCNAGTLTGTNGQVAGNTLAVAAPDIATAPITCTYTNTRKSASLTLRKTWANALSGETATVSTGAGFVNAASSGLSTSTGNNTTTGTSVTVFAGESGAISETGTNLANYTASYACTGTSGLSGSTLTVGAADTAIICTLTNTRKSATLTLAKTWVNGRSGETATVSTGAGFTTAATSGLSTSTGNNTTTGTSVTVYAGESGAISETMTNGANYTSVLACTGTSGLSGTTLTVAPADTAITCTYTNTRRSTTFQLSKAWGANSIAGDVASIGATTGLTNNTVLFTATASTGASSAAVTVFAGETATLPAETMTTGTLANYVTVVSCTGGTLTGTDGQVGGNTVSFTAASTAAAITCSYTNTRRSTTLRVDKAWGANSIAGNVASIPATTGLLNNTAVLNSTASTNSTGAVVTVYAGEVATLGAETMTTGVLANYATALTCSGGTLSGADGQASNSLTVAAASTSAAITCTYTNTRKSTTFRLAKAWGANSIAGNVASIGATSGLANNTVLFTSTASTGTNGTFVTVYAGETATLPAETMTTGVLANYNTVVACSGGTLVGTNGQVATNTLNVTAASTAAAITCTYTNTRKQTNFRLRKAWGANSIAGNVANIGVTTGLINNTVAFTSTASTATNGATRVVYAGETATLPAETMSTGTLANYTTVVACNVGTLTGTDGQSAGNTVAISAADTATATITCTYTNTRKSASLTLRKTWSGATAGHTATVASSGFINAASSGVSTSAGNNTTTGTAVTVYAGESGTISETGSNLSSYIQALACTGSSGLSGTTLTVSNADTAIVCTYTNTLAVPLLTVAKTPSVPSVSAAGAAITYTIRVTNSGNVSATSVTVTDPLGTVTCPGGNPIPVLAVGAFVDCTLTYTVTQAVFDANGGGDGDIDNTASANGTTAFGAVSQSGSAAVTLTGSAGLTLSKTRVFLPGPTGDVNGNGTADVGDTIIYRYDVTNSGNRTVSGVNINFDNHNGYGSNPAPSSEVMLTDVAPASDSTDATTDASWDSLAPGDTVRFTWSYVVVQADIDLLQ